ncbi:PilW family protein [Rudaea sp.]|uniref:PilW family protein n=1 Tax=Rudaea sp. TaxID=2136325 RepID=UPI0032203CD8
MSAPGIYRARHNGASHSRVPRGFSLLEVMIALTLGLLLSLGLVTVFTATSSASKVQQALARLQENGRYGVGRIDADLRMLGAQYCENSDSQNSAAQANGLVYATIAIMSNVAAPSIAGSGIGAFPDSDGANTQLRGLPPAGWTAAGGVAYPITAAAMVRGYECTAAGSCTPTVPSATGIDGLPAAGTTAGTRVRGTDVLTIRYQRGTGWPFTVNTAVVPNTITLAPGSTDDSNAAGSPHAFGAGGTALISTCGGGQVIGVAAAGNVLTPVNLVQSSTYSPVAMRQGFDVRVFNFGADFVTVTYYLEYRADANVTGRVIPTLIRRENGIASEVVQGVERLDIRYGVQYADGSLRFMNASDVVANSNSTNCPAPPPQQASYGYEAECLWRSVKTIQVNMLFDSVDNQFDLSSQDKAYQYDGSGWLAPPNNPTATMTSYANGQIAGSMMRREFITTVAVRNAAR